MGVTRSVPVPLSVDALADVLADMADRVRRGDSFEGSIEYMIPGPEDEVQGVDARMVQASYRVGNLDGQGGIRMIGKMKTFEEDPTVH